MCELKNKQKSHYINICDSLRFFHLLNISLHASTFQSKTQLLSLHSLQPPHPLLFILSSLSVSIPCLIYYACYSLKASWCCWTVCRTPAAPLSWRHAATSRLSDACCHFHSQIWLLQWNESHIITLHVGCRSEYPPPSPFLTAWFISLI